MTRSQICKSCAEEFSLSLKGEPISWVDLCHWCEKTKNVIELEEYEK